MCLKVYEVAGGKCVCVGGGGHKLFCHLSGGRGRR